MKAPKVKIETWEEWGAIIIGFVIADFIWEIIVNAFKLIKSI